MEAVQKRVEAIDSSSVEVSHLLLRSRLAARGTVSLCADSRGATSLRKNMGHELKFDLIPEQRFDEVILHLRNSFFADEPLNRSLNLSQRGEPHEELESYSRNILQQGLSIMATEGENEQIAGVCLVGNPLADVNKDYEDVKLKKILGFIGEMVRDENYTHIAPLEEVLDLKILSVDGEMRGRGIGVKLVQNNESLARERGYKVLRSEATGIFSQKVLEKLGWETVKEVRYDEYPSQGNVLFKVEPPHISFKLMVKRLN